jgi:phosphopantothenoylcysteine decarboxylase/phosphopantothenate--cysteine ligase
LKKRDGLPRVELEATADILAAVAQQRSRTGRPGIVAGFAAESHDLVENAADKLQSKNLDMIVANDITVPGTGFGAENNRVILLHSDGRREDLPLMSKIDIAETIIKRLAVLLES